MEKEIKLPRLKIAFFANNLNILFAIFIIILLFLFQMDTKSLLSIAGILLLYLIFRIVLSYSLYCIKKCSINESNIECIINGETYIRNLSKSVSVEKMKQYGQINLRVDFDNNAKLDNNKNIYHTQIGGFGMVHSSEAYNGFIPRKGGGDILFLYGISEKDAVWLIDYINQIKNNNSAG